MFEQEVVVTSDAGVHARPAGLLVKEAQKYPCEVFLVKDDIVANAKSIMSLLGLAITSGTKLVIKAEGSQEQEAVAGIVDLIRSNFKK